MLVPIIFLAVGLIVGFVVGRMTACDHEYMRFTDNEEICKKCHRSRDSYSKERTYP